MRLTLLVTEAACFASFGWAMLRHFQRAGKTGPGTIFTAAVAPAFAGLHVMALAGMPLAQPRPALVLYMGGAALFWWTVRATRGRGLAACFQGRIPPAVIRDGPYRWMRHPFYTSYTLVWLAGFAATGWWPLAMTAGFMASLYGCAAYTEERDLLRSVLREDYRNYKGKRH